MPKIVDRDARRSEILNSYLDLVAREGSRASTSRRLAQELQVATGSLWNYFANFEEMLSCAFLLVFERTNERIEQSVAGKTGIEALVSMLEQIHPLEKTTHDEALIVMSFWGRVASHSDFTPDQNYVERHWHASYTTYFAQALERGELRVGTPIEQLADALVVLAVGYQVEDVLGTPLAESLAQRRVIYTVLMPWLSEPDAWARRIIGDDPAR